MSKNRPAETARDILQRVGASVPIDLTKVLAHYPVTLTFRPMEDSVSGMLVVRAGRGIIAINQSQHENRQRFSIAHELGHFLLHIPQTSGSVPAVWVDAGPVLFRDRRSADGTDMQEIEANAFAAELLMPEEAILQRLHQASIDEDKVAEMAADFKVSASALTVRLTRLGLLNA